MVIIIGFIMITNKSYKQKPIVTKHINLWNFVFCIGCLLGSILATSIISLQNTAFGATASPLLLKKLNYDTGDLSQWICKENAPPTNTLNVVTKPSQPVIQGSHSLKVTLKSNAVIVPGTNGERAEVKYCDSPGHVHLFKNNDDIWISWYTGLSYFNFTIPTIPNAWHVLTQWHGLEGSTQYGIPLTLNLNGDILNLRVNTIKYDTQNPNCTSQIIVNGQPNTSCGYLYAKQVEKGHWYKVILHIKWSTSSANGLVEGSIDGMPIKTFRGNILNPSGSADSSAYLKQGLYRNSMINVLQEVYHDGTVIAKCPSNFKFNPDTLMCFSP
jgi:hypothetical protein